MCQVCSSWVGVEQAMDEIKEAMRDQMVWIPLNEAGAVGGCGAECLTHIFTGSFRLLYLNGQWVSWETSKEKASTVTQVR